MDDPLAITLQSGEHSFVFEDNRGKPLPEYFVAVVSEAGGDRWSHCATQEQATNFVRRLQQPPLTDVIGQMEQEIADGEDPENLFLFCSYMRSLATPDREKMSFKHFLGYHPPADEDIMAKDGSVWRKKGQAEVIMFGKVVANYIDIQQLKPSHAVAVTRAEMTRLLLEYGYFGGKINDTAEVVDNQGVVIAKFPLSAQVIPKTHNNDGHLSYYTWKYTEHTDVYITCKKEKQSMRVDLLHVTCQ